MTTKTDAKRRVVLPGAEPGEIYDVQKQSDGTYLLVRLERPKTRRVVSKEESLRAMNAAPLTLSLTWDELASMTREP